MAVAVLTLTFVMAMLVPMTTASAAECSRLVDSAVSAAELSGKINRWAEDLRYEGQSTAEIAASQIDVDSDAVLGIFKRASCMMQQKEFDPAAGKLAVSEAVAVAEGLTNFTLATCRNVSVEGSYREKNEPKRAEAGDVKFFEDTERVMGTGVITAWLDFAKHNFNDKSYRGQKERHSKLNDSCVKHSGVVKSLGDLLRSIEAQATELRYSDYQCDKLFRNQEVCLALFSRLFLKIIDVACGKEQQRFGTEFVAVYLTLPKIVRQSCSVSASTTAPKPLRCITVEVVYVGQEALTGKIRRNPEGACGSDRIIAIMGRGVASQKFSVAVGTKFEFSVHFEGKNLKASRVALEDNMKIVCMVGPDPDVVDTIKDILNCDHKAPN